MGDADLYLGLCGLAAMSLGSIYLRHQFKSIARRESDELIEMKKAARLAREQVEDKIAYYGLQRLLREELEKSPQFPVANPD